LTGQTPPDATRQGGLRAALLAAPAYLALALAATWPSLVSPTRHLIGHTNGDQWPNLWGYAWVRGELLAGRVPVEVTQISHPAGGQLYFTDLLDALLAVPLLTVLELATTYNLLLWFNLTLAAVGAFALARHLTGSSPAAFLAGLAYGFSPYLLGNAASGVTETVTGGWLPLAALALWVTGEGGRWRTAVVAGVLLAATAIACLYYGLVAGALAALIVAYGLLLRRPRWSLRRAVPLALAALVSAAIFGPIYLTVNRTMTAGNDFEVPPLVLPRAYPVDWRQASPVTDAANLLLPGKLPTGASDGASENTVFHVTYLGFALLVLAGLGMLPRKPAGEPRGWDGWRDRAFWLGIALLFGLLSMGEYLVLAGEEARLGGMRLALPGALLTTLLPISGVAQHTFRYFVVVTLALALLGAGGWRWVLGKLPAAPIRWVATAAAAALLLAETWVLSPAPLPVPTADATVPRFYVELAADPDDYAVLDLPYHHENWVHERYLYYAAVHGKNTPYTINAIATGEVRYLPIVEDLHRWTREENEGLNEAAGSALDPAPLLSRDFELVVVHLPLLAGVVGSARAREGLLVALEARFGAPTHRDEQVVVYSLRGGALEP